MSQSVQVNLPMDGFLPAKESGPLALEDAEAKSTRAPSHLRHLDDQELSDRLKKLIRQERKITSWVLAHLEEVERRKLFAKRGYSSLFAYCTEELGYSASAAQRRISSMRLAKQVPEVKEKLESGKLNLTTLAMAGSFFRQEKVQEKTYSVMAKTTILESLENKSTREVAESLVQISPQSVPRPERLRPVGESLTEVKLTLNTKQMKKLQRLRQLGVTRGKLTTAEVLDWAMEIALFHSDPLLKAERAKGKMEQKRESDQSKSLPLRQSMSEHQQSSRRPVNTALKRKPIPASVRHHIYLRDKGCCTYRDPKTGKVRGATNALGMSEVLR